MTKAEKMVKEWLILVDLEEGYKEDLLNFIHEVATQKTISILKKTAWGMEEGGPGTEFVFCSDIIKDQWEDEIA